jgi:2-methylcitrate dehydratase PrpD
MQKIKVTERAEFSEEYPSSTPCRMTVRLDSGEIRTAEVRFPRGHSESPVDDAGLEKKFRALFRDYGDTRQCDVALRALWDVDQASDIAHVLRPLVRTPRDESGGDGSRRAATTEAAL